MSMLTLNGQVLNVFDQAASTDKETGEIRPAKSRVQIMAENELQNGQKRHELVNLTAEDPDLYRKLAGKVVSVPVGAFVASGTVMFYALKGQKPSILAAATGAAPARTAEPAPGRGPGAVA
ncbi:MAG: hypothetical protein M0P95_02505 [Sulfuritalea sp.]|jgi:hypothetical protein|nr:hypothetical protein [Sulfuritalea sp.]